MAKSQSARIESMEVTREEHLRQMDDRSSVSKASTHGSRSSGSRKSVKSRFAKILKPKHSRGVSAPVEKAQTTPSSSSNRMQRSRAYSAASAPSPTSRSTTPSPARKRDPLARPSTPQRKHSRPKTTPDANERIGLPVSPLPIDDSSSILSDNVTVEGLRSVATNQTISSVETVKASNKTDLPAVEEDAKETTTTTVKSTEVKNKSAWKKFKRSLKFRTSSSPDMGKKEVNKTESAPPPPAKKYGRRRVQSFDKVTSGSGGSSSVKSSSSFGARSARERRRTSSSSAGSHSRADLATWDQSVRGRFDGLDVLTLGLAMWTSSAADIELDEKPQFPWENTRYTVTGQSTCLSPAELVRDMLWSSGGRPKPEMILEGYLPGPEDRWSVQIEKSQNPLTCALESPPPLQPTATDENTASTATDDQESPLLSSHKLWTSLWGSDPVPSGQPNRELLTQVGDSPGTIPSRKKDEDPLLSLAADSSIPIDIDEDTFIVSTRDHLMAIQNIASIPLAEGRFDTALKILEKLLSGLPAKGSGERRFLRGATLHNIGLIHLWQGNYVQANAVLEEALKERRKRMDTHMDLVVTQCRQAQCLFALERFNDAEDALEECLDLVGGDGVIKAKILNNLAIVYYHRHEVSKALRHLARALEEQRGWLDGPVRRESIVYDASVSLSNMGKLYLDRCDFELCCAVYEEALLLQTSIFQKDHPAVLQGYASLAWAKALSGHSRTALRLLESCLRVQTMHFGADASVTVETAGWMAHLYARIERYDDALPVYHRIRQWQKQHLKTNSALFFISGPNPAPHPSVRLVKDCIKEIDMLKAPKSSLSMWL